jgi:hypothetical protein
MNLNSAQAGTNSGWKILFTIGGALCECTV